MKSVSFTEEEVVHVNSEACIYTLACQDTSVMSVTSDSL